MKEISKYFLQVLSTSRMQFVSSLKSTASPWCFSGLLQPTQVSVFVLQGLSTSSGLHKDSKAESMVHHDLIKSNCDCIGPPHPVSRLRPVHYHVPEKETPLQTACRAALTDTQHWNQEYWLQHNTSFEKEKQAFITIKLREKQSRSSEDGGSEDPAEKLVLTSDEMAEFYKHFLNKNYDQHMQYNREWYKKNFANIKLAAKVWLESKFQHQIKQK